MKAGWLMLWLAGLLVLALIVASYVAAWGAAMLQGLSGILP